MRPKYLFGSRCFWKATPNHSGNTSSEVLGSIGNIHTYIYIYTVHHICMRLYWCIVPFYAVHCLSRRCKKAFNTENVKHVLELRGRHTWEWYGLIICIYTCTHLTGSLFQNWNCSPHASSMNYDLLFEKNINRPTEDHIIHIVYVIYIYTYVIICNYVTHW